MVLKVKVLKSFGVTTTENHKVLVKEIKDDKIVGKLERIENEQINYMEWKKMPVEGRDRKFKRLQLVRTEASMSIL